MRWPPRSRGVTVISLLALFTLRELPGIGIASSQQTTNSTFCSTPEYREFDFWVGDWDAFDFDKPEIVARTRVDRILGGCVLREDYQGASGFQGQSFSSYDAPRKQWQQTWVTNRGTLLVIEGQFQAGEMVLSGVDHAHGDQLVRGTWKPSEAGVRETAVISTDGGKTWKPWFDLLFRTHRP
jgi:hypothetical protein